MTSIYAEKTQKGYQSALNGFRKFADEFNLDNNILAHSAPSAQPVWIAYALWCKTKAKILHEIKAAENTLVHLDLWQLPTALN